MMATLHTIVRCSELLRSSHTSEAIAMLPKAMPSHASARRFGETRFMSVGGGGDRRGVLIRENHLSGSPQIAPLAIIREVRNFHGDAVLLLEQRGRRYRIVRSGRCNAREIYDATWHHHIAIAQSKGRPASDLQAIIDSLANHGSHQCGIAIEQPQQVLAALYLLSRRCQQFPHRAGRRREDFGV